MFSVHILILHQFKSISNEIHFRPCPYCFFCPDGFRARLTILTINKRGWQRQNVKTTPRRGVKHRKVMWTFLDTSLLLMFYTCIYSTASSPLYSASCQLQGQFHLNGMHKSGDVVLGGLFGIHYFSTHPDLSFTSEPQQPTCHGWVCQGTRKKQKHGKI